MGNLIWVMQSFHSFYSWDEMENHEVMMPFILGASPNPSIHSHSMTEAKTWSSVVGGYLSLKLVGVKMFKPALLCLKF